MQKNIFFACFIYEPGNRRSLLPPLLGTRDASWTQAVLFADRFVLTASYPAESKQSFAIDKIGRS